MNLLIGTRDGAFRLGSGPSVEGGGLDGQPVTSLCRVNGSVLAGTENGIYRSGDGQTWHATSCQGRAIRAIAVAPGDTTIYAGTQPAALCRSTDGGSSWSEVESLTRVPSSDLWGLPGDPSASRALAIVIEPDQPERCWVGIEVGGVMETRDGGATWQPNLVGQNPDIHMLVRDPGRADVLYATTGFGRVGPGSPLEEQSLAGAYRSDDGGRSWRYIWPDHELRYTRPMCIDARAPHALTVASSPNFRASYRDPEGARVDALPEHRWGRLLALARRRGAFAVCREPHGPPARRRARQRNRRHGQRRGLARQRCGRVDDARQRAPARAGAAEPRLSLYCRYPTDS